MPVIPYDMIKVRDELQELCDEALLGAAHTKQARQYSERLHLAALLEAWRILDSEVARLAEEE